MNSTLRYLTSLLLIATPLVFAVCLTLLLAAFNYPDILREPTDTVLRGFTVGGPGLVATWYGAAFSALLFIPLALALRLRLAPRAAPYLVVGTVGTVNLVSYTLLGNLVDCRGGRALQSPARTRENAHSTPSDGRCLADPRVSGVPPTSAKCLRWVG